MGRVVKFSQLVVNHAACAICGVDATGEVVWGPYGRDRQEMRSACCEEHRDLIRRTKALSWASSATLSYVFYPYYIDMPCLCCGGAGFTCNPAGTAVPCYVCNVGRGGRLEK